MTILGPDGMAIPAAAPKKRAALGDSGVGMVPYNAASYRDNHVAEWQPYLWSADAEKNIFRDRIVSRIRDLVRNDGWASGGITRIVDNVIGGAFRPKSKPDYRALQRFSGLSTFDASWAHEFSAAVESHYRDWANDEGRWSDAARGMTQSQMNAVAFRHLLIDGDALGVLLWLEENVGPGRARYATSVQLIDPDRLSNPQLRFDSNTMRGGVAVNDLGASTGYWIRAAHQGDWWSAAKSMRWDLIPRETSWGRPVVAHFYERSRAGEHRGGGGILTPVLSRLRMLARYDEAELDAAVINAVLGAYVESPFDQTALGDMLAGGDGMGAWKAYQSDRDDWHRQRNIQLGPVSVRTLYPGEQMKILSAARPAGNFPEFEGAVLRNVASAMGMSSQQLSQNWSDVNYSSARAALLEAWKTLRRRRHDFAMGFSQTVWVAWLEESFDVDDLPLPAGAPEFVECRRAYAQARWLGPGRGWIDPVAEKQGAVLGMDAALSTMEDEVEENEGGDWEEKLDQREREIAAFKARNLTPPTWAGMQPGVPARAEDTIRKPAAA